MRARFEADGDVIVITGGANGIGRALADALAKIGVRVVVCDVDEEAMAEAETANALIATRRLDVSDRDAVMTTFAGIEAEFGRIDGLVCAAAIQPRNLVHETSPDEWRRVISTAWSGAIRPSLRA
jgi:2-hydroxycyclohexanecarboxyl-CoA dehydrogenase